MKKIFGFSMLITLLFMAACGGDEVEVPAPIACFSPIKDTSVMVGSVLNFTSCSENAEELIWKIDGAEKAKSASFSSSFSQAGIFKIKLEAYNSAGDSTSTYMKVTVGYPCVKKIVVRALADGGFNPNFPKYTLSLNATDYTTSWTRTVSGKYKDITSLPQTFDIPDHLKYKLGTGIWELKGGLTWNGTPAPVLGTTEFHAQQSYTDGKYSITIPGVALIELIPVFEP